MTPEQWRRAAAIAELASRRAPAERPQFLFEQCGDDQEYRGVVEALLDAMSRAVGAGAGATTLADDAQTRTATPPGTTDTPHPQLEPSTKPWGEYTLLEQIGRGGFGTVHRAWDPVLHRDIALKVIDLSRLPAGSEASVLREGQLMARVRHRNVVTIFRAQRIGNEIGLAMELVRGRTLAEMVHQNGPLKIREVLRIGSELCDALDAVHREGLVHHDVKASNVMKDRDGRVVLMDFGAGRERALEIRSLSGVVGTPLYMAPEVLDGHAATPAADLYSLGVLLHYLLSGGYPVDGEGFEELIRAHRAGRRSSLRDLRPEVPDVVVRVVDKTLSPALAERPRSALSLKRELKGAEEASSRKTSGRRRAHPAGGARPAGFDAGSALQMLALTLGVGVVLCGFCGFLTTTAFNVALARPPAFAAESPLQHLVWGARSLVAPVALLVLAVVVVNAISLVVGLVLRLFPRLQRLAAAAVQRGSEVVSRAGLAEPGRLAQVVCLIGLVAVAAVAAPFSALISAILGGVNDAPVADLALLGSAAEDSHVSFRLRLHVIELFLVGGLIAVHRLAQRRGERIGLVPAVSIAAPLLVALFLASISWRILFSATFPILQYAGTRCFEVGSRADELLVSCPSLPPPRNLTVSRGHPELRRTGAEGNLFDDFAHALPSR